MKTLFRVLVAGLCILHAAAGAARSTVVDLVVDGGTFRFLYVAPEPPVAATASILSISGNDGFLGIADDGTMTSLTARCGPLTRNRDAVAASGIALALMNMPPSPAQVVAVDAWLRERHAVPTWISGGSAATAAAAYQIANVPAGMATGVLFFAPGRLTAAEMSAITRPALVISHADDGLAFPTLVYNGLVNARAKERVIVRGGTDTPPCGNHLFWDADAEFLAGVTGFIARNNTFTSGAEAKRQALWYAAPAESEPGWGVNLAHQGDILFATWFTYDAAGPMWLVMSNGARVGTNRYQGALYRTTGPAFDAVPFDPTRVTLTEVGAATFDFADADRATFSYTVNGIAQSKAITRQVFGTVSECFAGPPSATNFQDLWWVPAESGWGVNITHQGDILFGTWFTYGRDGRGQWLVMSRLDRVGTTGARYAGPIYRTAGSAFNTYDATRLSVAPVGTATFDFSGAAAGTFTYTLDGVTQSKAISRQTFSTPTTCR